jgi:hypothetical protein
MMFLDDEKEMPRLRRILDDPSVTIRGGDIETAIRILRLKVQLFGNHKVLNIRRKYPNSKDRRRIKDRKAGQRFLRNEKIRQVYKNE